MKIVVIGANGFIGSNLVKGLAERRDIEVYCFSRSSHRLKPVMSKDNVKVILGDFNDLLSVVPLLKDADVVYHLASTSVPSTSWYDPSREIEQNLISSTRLFKLAASLGVGKMIYISSGGAIYGQSRSAVKESDPVRPISPYGITKMASERFLEYFKRSEGLEYVCYRLSNVYGSGLDKVGFGVINTWLKDIANNREVKLYGDGKTKKDFIYIEDVVKIISEPISNERISGVYNLASGNSLPLNDLLALIGNITDKDIIVRKLPGLNSDVSVNGFNIKKLINDHEIKSLTELKSGIEILWSELNRS